MRDVDDEVSIQAWQGLSEYAHSEAMPVSRPRVIGYLPSEYVFPTVQRRGMTLLHTRLLLRAAGAPERLSGEARSLLADEEMNLQHGESVGSRDHIRTGPSGLSGGCALAEGILLLTADAMVARYPGPIRQV